jgi:hypothetical protein
MHGLTKIYPEFFYRNAKSEKFKKSVLLDGAYAQGGVSREVQKMPCRDTG